MLILGAFLALLITAATGMYWLLSGEVGLGWWQFLGVADTVLVGLGFAEYVLEEWA